MMIVSRRDFLEFLEAACAIAAWTAGLWARGNDQPAAQVNAQAVQPSSADIFVNDIHSQLNRTRVSAVYAPNTVQDLRAILQTAKARQAPVSLCGRRHSMGGQQFGTGNMLIDMTAMNRVLNFDKTRG